MSKKNKKAHKYNAVKRTPRVKKTHWPVIIKRSAIGSIFLAIFAGVLFFNSQITKADYDISVIGNGTPAVVQIHDPNCRLCRQLKNNLDDVKGEFQERINFRTVNIASNEGRKFARQHNVPHVTLLFFDARGKRVNVIQGVTPAKDIHAALVNLRRQR